MGMIDRYRKKGGFLQLLNLIETTGKDKQEKFLKMIADENPAWEEQIRTKMLTLDRVLSWSHDTLSEIFHRMPPINTAMIVGGISPEKAQPVLNCLSPREKKSVEFALEGKTVTSGETLAAVMKLFTEIRKMAHDGIIKFEKIDPELLIPEDIEEQLNHHRVIMSVQALEASSPEAPSQTPSNVVEELTLLRKKLVHLTQENQKLHMDNQQMREKLEQIRKIA